MRIQCEILYRDDSWALLQFANIKLALNDKASYFCQGRRRGSQRWTLRQ